MNQHSFFNALEKQYNSQLPFVVYSRPINSFISCWLQKDAKLHTTESFSERGFVFAPFSLNDKSILLPQEHCEHYTLEIDNLVANQEENDIIADESSKTEHLKLISKGIETIKNSSLEKVVLSRQVIESVGSKNPIDIFKRLFNTYKNAMVYCWYHPKIGLWLGATPELLFKLEGKQLTTISLAGTQPFVENESVSWTHKEYKEQQIVTDYIVNQIEPFTDQVSVSDVETVRAGKLLHLKTRIISRINEVSQLKFIIRALHPTPAVCGFPRQIAKGFILKNENYKREYYTGFLGELNLKQSKTRNTNRRNVENNAYAVVKTQSNFYVNLRCMQLLDKKALIYVGGGITKDSNPEKEWDETVNKTKTIVNVIN
ncbi:chorismate-binding protein [Winogradskyella sp.]|uniref:chorismate-binding protein n=1 Tax=Winogradskyella sp. TaxID=1883156 RepID=UPI003F6B74BE